MNQLGEITLPKSRLFAFGYQQQKCSDYFETFAATPNGAPLCLLLATEVKERLPLSYFDTKPAFERSDIGAKTYLRLHPSDGPLSQKVVVSNKVIYSLK